MPARFNFPLFLTWLRIVAIPLFVAVLYVPESWISEHTAKFHVNGVMVKLGASTRTEAVVEAMRRGLIKL